MTACLLHGKQSRVVFGIPDLYPTLHRNDAWMEEDTGVTLELYWAQAAQTHVAREGEM